jgi:hypothetical protein
MQYTTYNQFIFGMFILLALVLFYQSWMNLIRKQLTKFSLDALILFYVRLVRGEKQRRKTTRLLIDEPQRIRSLGIIALVAGVLALYQAIDWYLRYLRS